MKLLSWILSLAFTIVIFSQSIAQTTFIPLGSDWDYYDNEDKPDSQDGTKWYELDYDASDWDTAPAELGYGDGDEETVLNRDAQTCYFRYILSIEDPSQYRNLKFDLYYDDGAVVYINGEEVRRVNLPSGNLSYHTLAQSSVPDNSLRHSTIDNDLVEGDNIIAVEIHQKSTSSSDLSFDFKFWGTPPKITRTPYLQKLTNSSVLIRWRTSTRTSSVVDYGTSLSDLDETERDLTPKKDHEIEISGLEENTIYYYQIGNTAFTLVPADEDMYFKTAPETGSQPAITAWILGDCGSADDNQEAVRDAYYDYIGDQHTDMILFLGDNAYTDGTDEEYEDAVFDMYDDKLKNTVSWSCLGNHDGLSANSNSQTGPYYDIFSFPTEGESGGVASGTEAYYSFDYGNIHFISLDSYDSDRSEGGLMYDWCESDLQNTSAEWIVAFWHHPPYSKGSHDSDVERPLRDMREIFLPLLESYGVDLVLSGHSHSYERSYFLNGHYGKSNTFDLLDHTVGFSGSGDGRADGEGAYRKETEGSRAGKGAVYITAGSSGKVKSGDLDHEAIYYGVEELGSCIMEVEGNQMTVKFIRENGNIEDYFTIIKPDEDCDPGDSCDDLNPCTVNDRYDSDCNCSGRYRDEDGDGLCIGQDPDDEDGCNPNPGSLACSPCQVLYADAFEAGFGNWTDGGSDCNRSSKHPNSGNFSVELRDNTGKSSSIYLCDLDLSDYEELIFEFSYYAVGVEPEEDFFLEISTDGGDSYESPYARWILGTDFEKNKRYIETVYISGVDFSDDNCIRLRCDASGNSDKVYFDDIFIKNCESACTEGDPCDDGDPCTIDDELDEDCHCAGTYADNDADGICAGNDPDDNNGCNPDPASETSCNCEVLLFDGFENGFDEWNDGGADCYISGARAYTGDKSLLIRDDSEEKSGSFSDKLDLSDYSAVTVGFTYFPEGMEDGEDFFLEISTDAGTSYSVVTSWVADQDFQNNTRYFENVLVSGIAFGTETRFRFRCDASSNGDQIYIDDVEIKGCNSGQGLLSLPEREELPISVPNNSSNNTYSTYIQQPDSNPEVARAIPASAIHVFPNPANSTLFLDLSKLSDYPTGVTIHAIKGSTIIQKELNPLQPKILELDIRALPAGVYYLELLHPEILFELKKLVILKE